MDTSEYAREPDREERFAVYDALLETARGLAQRLEPPENPVQCEHHDQEAPEFERRRAALALLHALTVARHELEDVTVTVAWNAGRAGASYADIGAAAGMSRQAARNRWPNATTARPGRPPLPATTKES